MCGVAAAAIILLMPPLSLIAVPAPMRAARDDLYDSMR